MRFTVDLHNTDGGVNGYVTWQGSTEPQPFSNWLDLLRLLEPGEPPAPDAPDARRRPECTPTGWLRG